MHCTNILVFLCIGLTLTSGAATQKQTFITKLKNLVTGFFTDAQLASVSTAIRGKDWVGL